MTRQTHSVPLRQGAIAVLPYDYRLRGALADVPLTDLQWPLGGKEQKTGLRLADLEPQETLLIYPSLRLLLGRHAGLRAGLAVLFAEPRAQYWHFMWLTAWLHKRFRAVVSCDARLNATLPNAVFCPFGGLWVPEWKELDTGKSRMLSLIASAKRALPGHKLRHRVVRWLRAEGIEADVMGRGYREIARKSEGLAPYRFSVVIENSREKGYFSEKLIDALMCRTVPIYWGAPDIGDYFDTEGMIVCQSFEDIAQACRQLSEADHARRAPQIEANLRAACAYHDHEQNAAHRLSVWQAARRDAG